MLPLKLKYDKAHFNEDLLFIGLIFHEKNLFKKKKTFAEDFSISFRVE